MVQRDQGVRRADVATQPALQRRGQLREAREAVGDVEAGILRRGDEQRALREVDILLRAGDDLFPAFRVSHKVKTSIEPPSPPRPPRNSINGRH
ncbi:hypothetical protein D3C83_40210 [compost metagenome]